MRKIRLRVVFFRGSKTEDAGRSESHLDCSRGVILVFLLLLVNEGNISSLLSSEMENSFWAGGEGGVVDSAGRDDERGPQLGEDGAVDRGGGFPKAGNSCCRLILGTELHSDRRGTEEGTATGFASWLVPKVGKSSPVRFGSLISLSSSSSFLESGTGFRTTKST